MSRLNELDVPGTVDFDRVYRIVDKLTEIGRDHKATPAQVALNWVMNKPGVDTVIIGARDEAQLLDNLAAASWRLSADEMKALDEVSALPEPYPMWHQHKFGVERNPRLPSVRCLGSAGFYQVLLGSSGSAGFVSVLGSSRSILNLEPVEPSRTP